MKVIFLDIDGVLNCDTTTEMCAGYTGIDRRKLKLFSQIVKTTGAQVVLTSTWKDNWYPNDCDKYQQDELADYLDTEFASFGITIYDKTVDNLFNRGVGIKNWLEKQKVEKFVILDDMPFDYKEQNLLEFLVKTNTHIGLTSTAVQQAISILND